MTEKKDTMIKVGALWANEKDGKTYYSGKFGDAKMLVFENSYKESDKHPSHIVYLAPFEKKEDKKEEGSEEVPF